VNEAIAGLCPLGKLVLVVLMLQIELSESWLCRNWIC